MHPSLLNPPSLYCILPSIASISFPLHARTHTQTLGIHFLARAAARTQNQNKVLREEVEANSRPSFLFLRQEAEAVNGDPSKSRKCWKDRLGLICGQTEFSAGFLRPLSLQRGVGA